MEDLRPEWCQLTPAAVRASPRVLLGVATQQDALLGAGLVHCDVRWPNVLVRLEESRLVDLESILQTPPTRSQRDGNFMFVNRGRRTDHSLATAAWQLALLVCKAFERSVDTADDASTTKHWMATVGGQLFALALAADAGEESSLCVSLAEATSDTIGRL